MMGGFINDKLNKDFVNGAVTTIIFHLIKCSSMMKTDSVKNKNPLKNHEDKITNRLIARYLNAVPSGFRYETQTPENFDEETDTFIGRTDIKVLPMSHFCGSDTYFIIECKRVDGSTDLNRAYVAEGVARFADYPPKYTSHFKANIIFGYIVKPVDVLSNVKIIEAYQTTILSGLSISAFVLLAFKDAQYYLYSCEYESKSIGCIELKHLFYNFSDVMQ
jgi:hypothetical protein